jgi:hypothetical protein
MIVRPAHVAALALLCACADAPAAERTAVRGQASTVPRDTVVQKADIPPLDRGGTLLDSATVDVDGDGTPERVELGVNAGRDEQGEWNWDVHNQWQVVVRDGPDSYPLLYETVEGAAAFWVILSDSTHPAEILVQTSGLTTSGGGTRLQKFVFDRQRRGYVRTGELDGRGHRALYRGPPAYAEMTDLFPPTSWRGEEPSS